MIRRWLQRVTGVEGDELLPVSLLIGYGFLVMTSYYVIRPVRNSVFVERVGAENLSYVYILTALLVTAVVVVYSRYVDRIDPRALLLATFAFVVGGLVVIWALLRAYPTSVLVSGGFYIWVQLYILLLVSQFWLAGNLVFDTRQAKRLFGMVGAGLCLGAVAGSTISGFAASAIGSEALFLVAAGVMILCAAICLLLFPHMSRGREASGRLMKEIGGDAVRILFRDRHLRTIALIVLLMITVHKLLDYQVNAAVEIFIDTEDGMTTFWGRFYLVLSLVALGVQTLLTSPLLRRLGVGVTLLALPGAVLLATLAVVAFPLLATVALALFIELSLRYSLDQSTRELLYVPVATEAKYKVKPLIDLAVYRTGTGMGGLLLVLFVNWLGFGFRGVAVVTLALVLVWIGVALWMRREYVRTLVRSFRRRTANVEDAFTTLADADLQPLLSDALTGGDGLQVAFALDLLARTRPRDVREHREEMEGLLSSDSPEIRARVLDVLARVPDEVDVRRVEAVLDDPDSGVREAAVRTLCVSGDEEPREVLRRLLRSDAFEIRLAALTCLVRDRIEGEGFGEVAREHLDALDARGPEGEARTRREIALAAGVVDEVEEARRRLEPLLDDPDPAVARAALESAGRLGDEALHPHLIRALADPDTGATARRALVRQGEGAVDLLLERLRDPDTGSDVRREIPSVLARIPTQEVVDGLLDFLCVPDREWEIDFRALKALNKLRRRHEEGLRFEPEPVEMTLRRELEAAEEYRALVRAVRESPERHEHEVVELLERSLVEAWRLRREVVFRCLGLLHPPEEVYRAYLVLARGGSVARSNALEWLEHRMERERFLELVPVLEGDAGRRGDWPAVELDAALWNLWHAPDEWLRRCAIRAAVDVQPPGLERRLELLGEGPDPGVRGAKGNGGLDRVEKVLRLQGIELLEELSPSKLAMVAGVAEEVELPGGATLAGDGRAEDAMHVVLEGSVEVRGDGERREVGEGGHFGSWAMVASDLDRLEARAVTDVRCLRVRRGDFERLLASHSELRPGVLRSVARRVRGLGSETTPGS